MRTVFKTSYDADINMFQHRYQFGWYCVACWFIAACCCPFVSGLLLAGRNDQPSHLVDRLHGGGLWDDSWSGRPARRASATPPSWPFGAYANVLLQERLGFPLPDFLPAGGVDRRRVRRADCAAHDPAARHLSRHRTLAVTILVDDFIVIAAPLTNGVQGLFAPAIEIFGLTIDRYRTPMHFYYLALVVTLLVVFFYRKPAALAPGARLRRDPRFRDLGPGHGCQTSRAPRPFLFGISARHHRPVRRAARPLCRHLQQRDLQHHHLDPVAAGHRHRWRRVHPRRVLREPR